MTKALEEAIVAQETNGTEYNQTCQIPLLTEKKEEWNPKKKIVTTIEKSSLYFFNLGMDTLLARYLLHRILILVEFDIGQLILL